MKMLSRKKYLRSFYLFDQKGIKVFFVVGFFLSFAVHAQAGGMVARRQNMMKMMQQQAIQQQMIQQQQMMMQMEMQRRQQEAMKQQMIQQQQEMMRQRMIEKQKAEYIAAQKKKAVQQAQSTARMQAMKQQKQKIGVKKYREFQIQNMPPPQIDIEGRMVSRQQEDNSQVKATTTLSSLMTTFNLSSRAWPLIIDEEIKDMVVAQHIRKYYDKGIVIRKPAAFYREKIDTMSEGSPGMLVQSIDQVLKIVAIIEYDFDNGQNKESLALKILGPQMFQRNKERLLREEMSRKPF